MADTALRGVQAERYEQHLIVGGELLRQDRVAEAKAEFEAALALHPDDHKALGLLGLACFRLSAFDDALPIYTKLVAFAPADPSFRLNLGLVHLKLNNPEAAIAELSRSRELDPSQQRTVSYLGLAYARIGDFSNAYRSFLQAGQTELAREMEPHLSAEERERIHAAVVGASEAGRSSGAYDAVEVGTAEAEPEEEIEEVADDDFIEEVSDDDVEEISDAVVAEIRPDPATGDQGAISRAVEKAAPSAVAAAVATRVAAGHTPPQPLSEFATARLIRPEEGDHPFEISAAGVLLVRVNGKIMSRTEGVIVSGGELAYEPAARRVRGASTGEPFGSDGRPLFFVTGVGHLVAAPLGEQFTAVILDDDIFYLREDLVFAFEESLRWENGNVPGSAQKIHMVQFRGHGCVAMRTQKPLISVKLAPERVLYVDAEVLAGWIGRVVPRVVAPAAGGEASAPFVECTGEGVVLIEEEDPPKAS